MNMKVDSSPEELARLDAFKASFKESVHREEMSAISFTVYESFSHIKHSKSGPTLYAKRTQIHYLKGEEKRSTEIVAAPISMKRASARRLKQAFIRRYIKKLLMDVTLTPPQPLSYMELNLFVPKDDNPAHFINED